MQSVVDDFLDSLNAASRGFFAAVSEVVPFDVLEGEGKKNNKSLFRRDQGNQTNQIFHYSTVSGSDISLYEEHVPDIYFYE